MRKFFASSTLLIPFVFSATNLSAEMNPDTRTDAQNGMNTCCEPMPTCCPPIVEDCCACNVCPPTGMITPNGGPCVKNALNLYLTADFLYWMAREENLAISATTGGSINRNAALGSPPPPLPPVPKKGKIEHPSFEWKPAFKVGLGLNFCHDGWDLFAEYTWFRSKHNHGSQSPNTQLLALTGTSESFLLDDPYWIDLIEINGNVPTGLGFANPVQTSGKWALNLNVIDLELGRNFYISPRLMLRPHFGLKGTWDKQHWTFTRIYNAEISIIPQKGVIKEKMDIWGIGPRAGLQSAWHLSRSFSLLGDLTISAIWEHFTVHTTQTNLVNDISVALLPAHSLYSGNFDDKIGTINPILEMMLGIRYETWLVCDTYHLGIDAGWEMQYWMNQNQFSRFNIIETSGGALILQGLTLKFRFDF